MAIFGMWPSACVRGRRVKSLLVIAVSAQEATLGIVYSRRHLPTWMTSGMFDPVGTRVSRMRPCVSVSVDVIGSPEALTLQRPHEAPVGSSSRGAFGT